MTTTADTRLHQLRAAIDGTLADPHDPEPRLRTGRLAGCVCLLLLDEADDRRTLLVDLLAGRFDGDIDPIRAAASSSPAASEGEPSPRPAEAEQRSTGRLRGDTGSSGKGGCRLMG